MYTHQRISFFKSVVRIIGYILLMLEVPATVMASTALILAEVVGIVEEIEA